MKLYKLIMKAPSVKNIATPGKEIEVSEEEFFNHFSDYPYGKLVSFEKDGVSNPQVESSEIGLQKTLAENYF
jgi:hypothetical protein